MKIIDISKCNEDVISYINELQNKYAELEKLNKELDKSNITIFEENNYLIKENKRLNNALKEYDRETYCKLINENRKLNNIINELEKSWKEEITRLNNFIQEDSSMIEINNIRKMLIQEREKDLYKLQELKGSESNENNNNK